MRLRLSEVCAAALPVENFTEREDAFRRRRATPLPVRRDALKHLPRLLPPSERHQGTGAPQGGLEQLEMRPRLVDSVLEVLQRVCRASVAERQVAKAGEPEIGEEQIGRASCGKECRGRCTLDD